MFAPELVREPDLSQEVAPKVTTRTRPLFAVAVVAGYFALGLIAYGPELTHLSSRLFASIGDFSLWIWSMQWTIHAVTHGLNPFFSNALFVPTGVNLGDNTSAPLLALLASPISLLFGPIVSANLVTVVAMPLSATSAFLVLRKWRVWEPGAALGGLAYGFSPYMIGQAVGHPQLVFLPLPPLIALTLTSIVQRRATPTRLGVELGLLVAAQFLISPEVLATVVVFGFLALAYAGARSLGTLREHARTVGRSVGIAALVAAPILAYPVWMMVAGPQHFSGSTIPAVNPYHNDLWSFLTPGPLQHSALGVHSLGSRMLGGNPNIGGADVTEAGAYLGLAVVAAVVVFAWRGRRSLRMQLAVLLILASLILSLGPHLAIGGRVTAIGLPFLLLDHLPLLDNILPSRLNYELGACVAGVIAFGLDDLHRRPIRGIRPATPPEGSSGAVEDGHTLGDDGVGARRGAVAAAVVLVALVATQLPRWPYQSQAASVLPAAVRKAVPAGDPVVITYPYVMSDTTVSPLVWQAEDGFAFRLLGGYAYHPAVDGTAATYPAGMAPPQLQRFLSIAEHALPIYGGPVPIDRQLTVSVREVFAEYHVRLAIVDAGFPGGERVSSVFTAALGPPTVSSGRFRVWDDGTR